MNFKSRPTLALISLLSVLGACGKSASVGQKPMVDGTREQAVTPPSKAETGGDKSHRSSGAVVSEVTFLKAEILDREFLYGADLQYSAVKDEDYELTLQALALGHWPARFRLIGDRLQLVVDKKIDFESDINHPERLVQEFQVVSQDADRVTVAITRASPSLAPLLGDSAKAPKERTSWVRSVKYVDQGNYLMIESSIEGSDGSIGEFMESVFPRETLVANAPTPIFADASLDPLAERFRFLDWGDVFMDVPGEGRIKTAVANRFAVKAGQTIDWYVTSNVPDTYLPQIRTGVEGWNRYFKAMGQAGLAFKGKLPSDVKIGDPRFNVINWDSVAEAGAAYESQASDPLTGLQSHSLVYLPLAWINIGKSYWDRGELSDKHARAAARFSAAIANRQVLGRKLETSCVNDAAQRLSVETMQNPDEFARELLKGVLLHEVGHALGLAHNFKASLSWDASNASTMFTTSIMDYNQYPIERAAYYGVDSADGPLLEYDRQILSALYNDSKDIKDTDPVLPACDDSEADSYKDGVDPLCIRYDSGKNPVDQMAKTRALIEDANATLGDTVSLPKALEKALGRLGPAADEKDAKTLGKKLTQLLASARGLVNFYTISGAQSLNYMTRANVKSLYIFQQGVLPAAYSEDELRRGALAGFQAVANLETLPAPTRAALEAVVKGASDWMKATPAFASLDQAKQEALAKQIETAFAVLTSPAFEKSVLRSLRASVLGSLVRREGAPFAMERDENGSLIDYEQVALAMLEKGFVSKLKDGSEREFAERAALVPALKSFAAVDEGRATIARVQAWLKGELVDVDSATKRDQLRQLLKALQ
jgi:hypothetical protein